MGKLAHTFPGAAYPALEDRMAAAGYDWSAVAENVAIDYRDAAGVVAGWMRSPGHRANILSTTYTEMGAGYATDSRGHRFFAQVFARPVP
ncbi:MAG TPA: CAP domain-containing protein [Gemmatimonadaceae bacterium]|nr:CAP domain-containing protein [Gemmatimonadaceae bacterium]